MSHRFLCSYVETLLLIKDRPYINVEKGKYVPVRPGVQAVTPNAKVGSPSKLWEPPPVGMLKLNVDVSFVTETGAAGAGIVLRDSSGTAVFSACHHLVTVPDALEAELGAYLEGLRLGMETVLSR